MKTINFLSYILCALMLVSACKKDDADTGQSYLNLKMTDSPGDYTAVNIDLEGIKVTNETGESYLVTANPGIYNLVELTNGKAVNIATGSLRGSDIATLTLILGQDNSIVVDGVTYPLRTSGAEAGLTVVMDRKVKTGENSVLLDFDVGQSIEASANDFLLRPVIRVVEVEFTGAIKGRIKSHNAVASITATGEGGTFTTFTSEGDCDHENWHGQGHHGYHDGNWDGWEDDEDDDGHHGHHGHHTHNGFFISAMPPGTYTVTIVGRDPYNTTVTLSNVEVRTGEVTNLGKITL